MSKKVDLDSLLFCSECKTIVNNLEDLYFVSEESDHGFCSEDCIETFYSPIVSQLQSDEIKFREESNRNSIYGLDRKSKIFWLSLSEHIISKNYSKVFFTLRMSDSDYLEEKYGLKSLGKSGIRRKTTLT